MPRLEINDTKQRFAGFLSVFHSYFDDFPRFSFLSSSDFKNTLGEKDGGASLLGRRIVFNKADVSSKGIVASVLKNRDLHLILDDGSELSTPHDFVTLDPCSPSSAAPLPDEVVHELDSILHDDPASCPKINEPLTDAQQELLRWNIRLGHLPFATLRQFAQLGLIPKHLSKVAIFPMCACCVFAKATKRAWRSKGATRTIRSENTNFPGGCISVDQLESAQTGMIPQSSGNRIVDRYVRATVFVDNFSRFVYVHHMTSLSSAQTIEAKEAFERLAASHGVIVKSYRADNGRFSDNAFREHCELCHQDLSYCGVGAHHQNGIAERHIGLLTNTARTVLLHAAKMWPEAITLSFWPFAQTYNL